ncbi:hypothetical protein ZWY2020_035954 [Hordeum vulgare]|nr:hypothetical protein ZWY2020_035954 [Hordeum vulgare]
MVSRKQKLLEKKKCDVLLSTDATKAQGFIFEGWDDHANVFYLDEEDGDVHPGMGISWDLLGEAMGAQEQLQLHRSARVRDLEEEEFESDGDDEMVDGEDVEYEDD